MRVVSAEIDDDVYEFLVKAAGGADNVPKYVAECLSFAKSTPPSVYNTISLLFKPRAEREDLDDYKHAVVIHAGRCDNEVYYALPYAVQVWINDATETLKDNRKKDKAEKQPLPKMPGLDG